MALEEINKISIKAESSLLDKLEKVEDTLMKVGIVGIVIGIASGIGTYVNSIRFADTGNPTSQSLGCLK